MAVYFAMFRARAGTATGLLLRDLHLENMKVRTTVDVQEGNSAPGTKTVDREGLVTG